MLGSQNNIDNTDQPTTIRGMRTGYILAKVVLVNYIHVIGLSIKRELLLPATT